MPEQQLDDVLTLAEAAAYLRVPEEEVLRLAEQRNIPAHLRTGPDHPKPGSKQAVRKHVGIFKDEADLEEVLASLHD
jgi:excisionase family DNA binding protein